MIQPSFIPGLTLSADYYSIKIRDAIDTVNDQDIVNTCYDNTQFPNQFCSLFERITPTSPGFTGGNTFGFRTRSGAGQPGAARILRAAMVWHRLDQL